MKTLLAILILVAGLNAYAVYTTDTLKIYNQTVQDLAVECFPSEHYCNGVDNGYSCTCDTYDTYLYFGRVGLPQKQAVLDSVTVYGYNFHFSDTHTGLHRLGNGNVWRVNKDLTSTLDSYEECIINGDPMTQVDCVTADPNQSRVK